MIFLNPSLREQGGFFLVLFGGIYEEEVIFIRIYMHEFFVLRFLSSLY